MLMDACGCGHNAVRYFLEGMWQGFIVLFRLIANLICPGSYHIHESLDVSNAYTAGYILGIVLFLILAWVILEGLFDRIGMFLTVVVLALVIWALTR